MNRYDYYREEQLLREERYDEYREVCVTAGKNRVELFNNIEDLLKQSMLDIPETFYKKLEDYIWGTLFEAGDVYERDENSVSDEELKEMQEDPNAVEGERLLDEYYRGGYIRELRALFDEYIVR